MVDLVEVSTGDLITSARANLVKDYINDGVHLTNTLSLNIGGVEVIDSSRNITGTNLSGTNTGDKTLSELGGSTLEEIQDNLGGTEGGDGDGFIKTANDHLTITYSDTTPSLTLGVIGTICQAPTGIEFGSASQEYDVDGETWVTAVAGGTLGGVPNAVAGHELSDCLTSIGTAYDSKMLVVRELAGAASATNPLTVQFLFSGITTFSSINTRSYYVGSVSHDVSIQLWNYTSSAFDTYATFSGETGYVIRELQALSVSNYISGGNVILQFIHLSSGNTAHNIQFDYVALCDGGGGSGSASIASAVTYTPTGTVSSTNVQTAINELDTEKLALLGGTMTGNLLFTDNTLDIGASGATRPRTLYLGMGATIPTLTATTINGNTFTTGTGTITITGTKTLTVADTASVSGTNTGDAPPLSGAGAPGTTPTYLGAIYIDTTNLKIYISTGTASSADWKKVLSQ